jgi:hypothetical protein
MYFFYKSGIELKISGFICAAIMVMSVSIPVSADDGKAVRALDVFNLTDARLAAMDTESLGSRSLQEYKTLQALVVNGRKLFRQNRKRQALLAAHLVLLKMTLLQTFIERDRLNMTLEHLQLQVKELESEQGALNSELKKLTQIKETAPKSEIPGKTPISGKTAK